MFALFQQHPLDYADPRASIEYHAFEDLPFLFLCRRWNLLLFGTTPPSKYIFHLHESLSNVYKNLVKIENLQMFHFYFAARFLGLDNRTVRSDFGWKTPIRRQTAGGNISPISVRLSLRVTSISVSSVDGLLGRFFRILQSLKNRDDFFLGIWFHDIDGFWLKWKNRHGERMKEHFKWLMNLLNKIIEKYWDEKGEEHFKCVCWCLITMEGYVDL